MRDHRRDGIPHGNLPLELDAFVGRGAQLAELARTLDSARLVTLTGSGGVGKSRLAARAAARRAPRDGVWRVQLAPVRDEEFVDYAVVEALGLTDHTTRLPRETLLAHLAERELLLLLDGVEHLVDACAALVTELLGRAPGLTVLAVGRRPLGVAGERLVPLAPLGTEEAVELLTVRAGQRSVARDHDADPDADQREMRELCRRLDGIPLAIELAAGRLDALSPGQMLRRLDDRFRLLTGGDRTALPRHRTLRTAIGWSHELCTPPERLLWARLSVFAGPFDLEAAEYVCSGDGMPADDVLDVLCALLSQSVLTREESPAGVRYRMLDTVRAYGADWLAATGDADRLRRRHRDWYVGLATWCELEWFSPRQGEVAARVDAELPNLRSALEHCLDEPDGAHLGQYLAGALWFHWVGCGRLSEGRHWLEQAVRLDAEPTAGEQSRLKALWVLAYVAILQGDTVPALAALQECREEAERSANPTAAAYAEHRTGCLALVTDDLPRAETLLRSALHRYREIGELNSNVLMGQVELAMARAFQGDLPDAVRLCEDVRQVCEDHGERWARGYALYVLAYAAWSDGEPVRARELLADCLGSAHRFRDQLGSVLAVELLALVTVAEGDAAEAAVLQGAAGRMWRSVGLPLFGSAHYNAPHELCEAAAREQLGDERYEECVRHGARLGRREAVARALRRPGARASLPAPRPTAVRRAPAGARTAKPAASPTRKGGETAG
ncbi:regulator [Streptomyces sp. ME02-6979A]|uniref:ATP-binding protein n=1 Tax=Streptomyces TaxID=1883 RepID=UPI0029ADD659|nr:AAA family ATPase [Streptomyces sp. ME02-6979A]MDX3345110.1 regulator [Streptomyces sp. ME02-6979A]